MMLDVFQLLWQLLAQAISLRNNFLKQVYMVLKPRELIKIARDRWKTDRQIGNKTGLSRTTIWRMEQDRFSFDPKTIGKLVKALNVE
jgi:transcriptional regulator with XRE-family HTH domain